MLYALTAELILMRRVSGRLQKVQYPKSTLNFYIQFFQNKHSSNCILCQIQIALYRINYFVCLINQDVKLIKTSTDKTNKTNKIFHKFHLQMFLKYN